MHPRIKPPSITLEISRPCDSIVGIIQCCCLAFRLKLSPLRHASEHHVEAVLSHAQTPLHEFRNILVANDFVRGCGTHYYFNMTILNKYGDMKMN
jgi:hypothetical protein